MSIFQINIFSEFATAFRQDEHVDLPDLNNPKPDDEDLMPDTTPFYANQMEDREVQDLYDQYINTLFR